MTCENWSNLWLNEGFTVFCERKVSEEQYGTNFAKVEALLGDASMKDDMESFGYDNSYSALYPVLNGDSPDNSFSEVPYEKGYQFLVFLESLIGSDNIQTFLQSYIEANKVESIDWTQL